MTMLRQRVSGTVLAGVLLSLTLVSPSSDAARAAPADCAVDVKSRRLRGGAYATGARHLFIVHTDGNGAQTAFRGGPSQEGGSSSSGSSGSSEENVIVVIQGPWNDRFVDWGGPSETSRRVMSGPAACAKKSCFEGEVTRINDTRTPYESTGPNSNTVVSTMLRKCDVPREHPGGWTPGWDDPDL